MCSWLTVSIATRLSLFIVTGSVSEYRYERVVLQGGMLHSTDPLLLPIMLAIFTLSISVALCISSHNWREERTRRQLDIKHRSMSIRWNTLSSMGGVTRSQSIKHYLTIYNSHYCWVFGGLDSLQQANTFILSGSCHWHVFNFISGSCMQVNVCATQIQTIKKTIFCLCKDRSCLSSHKFGAVLKSK